MRRLAALLLSALCGLGLAACTDTVQDRPISHGILEGMIVSPYPVYWLGGSFAGLQITEGSRDPGGAWAISYGNCLNGGQGVCTPPVRVITSPDNSFVPGGQTSVDSRILRGVRVQVSQGGRAIAIPTGTVVVSVFAQDPKAAARAARALVAINWPSSPGGLLPPPLSDTGFGSRPLPSQIPHPPTRPGIQLGG